TVPLKFEVFAGSTELTSITIVQAFVQKESCLNLTPLTDDIENYATGSTSLRYDTTGGQFIFNWQTPKQVGACYHVTLTTADGSTIPADFKLK
ncbi:MAG TPA: PxKF domain-containing protein, partial [Anaerolineales bacterium]|nr:PxKF domain-containing protein [Anaerolineales bacterium]